MGSYINGRRLSGMRVTEHMAFSRLAKKRTVSENMWNANQRNLGDSRNNVLFMLRPLKTLTVFQMSQRGKGRFWESITCTLTGSASCKLIS